MTLRNLDVEIGVPDTEATMLSELNIFEYLSPPLKKNKLNPKSIAKTKAIFDFPKLLNINIVASIIIVSIREIIMINLDKFSSFFIANWKLNGNLVFIDQYIRDLETPDDNYKCVVVCPTSIHLDYISRNKKNFYIGAQNISQYNEGPFTGEISSNTLSDLSVDFCIVGHSERRQFFYEKNTDINLKTYNLISKEIIPILCIGESLEEKEKGKTNEVLKKQLQEGISLLSKSNNTLIAYEPIWAIGSGLTPSLKEIDLTHDFIRNHEKRFKNFKLLYGGSVKASNAKEILSLSNVDGLLVGGASLKSEEFSNIIKD
jgi:triosephosphate isomerase (TIM)